MGLQKLTAFHRKMENEECSKKVGVWRLMARHTAKAGMMKYIHELEEVIENQAREYESAIDELVMMLEAKPLNRTSQIDMSVEDMRLKSVLETERKIRSPQQATQPLLSGERGSKSRYASGYKRMDEALDRVRIIRDDRRPQDKKVPIRDERHPKRCLSYECNRMRLCFELVLCNHAGLRLSTNLVNPLP